MQLQDALTRGIELLAKAGIPSPRITAEVLLMHTAHCDRAHLYAHPERLGGPAAWDQPLPVEGRTVDHAR